MVKSKLIRLNWLTWLLKLLHNRNSRTSIESLSWTKLSISANVMTDTKMELIRWIEKDHMTRKDVNRVYELMKKDSLINYTLIRFLEDQGLSPDSDKDIIKCFRYETADQGRWSSREVTTWISNGSTSCKVASSSSSTRISNGGGFVKINKIFDNELENILVILNDNLYTA